MHGKGGVMRVCTAMSVIETCGIVSNMKDEALRIASFYQGSIKIEINTNKENAIAKISVTEYNI